VLPYFSLKVLMPEPQVWLLLAGINFYPNEADRLRGAINDIGSIELGLKEYYKDINVIKLVASVTGEGGQSAPPEDKHLWPTWDNFTGNIKDITRKASADDVVWIHYSGHGTLRPTDNSEFVYQEGYGTDAALVLLEPDAQQGIRYLRGIELALVQDGMVYKGLKLTVVLDSCHSGSISRGEDSVRGIPWSVDIDSEFPLDVPVVPQALASQEKILRDTATTSHWLLHPKGYTLLAACGPHERAKEIMLKEEQQHHGALSHMICKAFDFCAQNEIQDVTHELIYRHVYANMFKVAGQHPILIGSDKTTLWGAEVAHLDARSTFEIIKLSPDQEIWMNAGLVHGVCTGDEYGVYVHAEAKEPVAHIQITDVEAVHAVAKYTAATDSKAGGSNIKVGYRAILMKLAQPQAYVKLCPQTNDSWKEKLDNSVWLQHLPSDELAHVDIPCFSVVNTQSNQYTSLDFKDDAITNLPPLLSSTPGVGDTTFTVLEHLSKYTFVQGLDNRRTNSLMDSGFIITVKAQADHLNRYKSKSSIVVPHASKVDLEFQNLTQEVLHFTVLDLSPLRQIRRVYPADKECQSVMPRNTEHVLPKEMTDIVPPGVVRLQLLMTVPARLREPIRWRRGWNRVVTTGKGAPTTWGPNTRSQSDQLRWRYQAPRLTQLGAHLTEENLPYSRYIPLHQSTANLTRTAGRSHFSTQVTRSLETFSSSWRRSTRGRGVKPAYMPTPRG